MYRALGCIVVATGVVNALNVRTQSVLKEDIFINGHPKTGTTWMTMIVQNIMSKTCNATAGCEMSTDYTTTEGPALSMHSTRYNITFMNARGRDVCCPPYAGFKHAIPAPGITYGQGWATTEPPELTDAQIAKKVAFALWRTPPTQKWVVMFRDPRDTILSACHHIEGSNCSDQVFRTQFVKNHVRSVALWETVRYRFFRTMQQSHPEKAIVVFFEDLKENPPKQISRVGTFLAMPLSLSEQKDVEAATSIKKVKKVPWQMKTYKVRKGKACGFHEELTDEDARAATRIMRDALSAELNAVWTC